MTARGRERSKSDQAVIPEPTLTVQVPLAFRRRSGRKQIVIATPSAAPSRDRPAPPSPVVKALARAFRWRDMLENGTYLTLSDLARAEHVSASYVSRLLQLTLVAPQLVEQQLDLREGNSRRIDQLILPVAREWMPPI
jgi:AraC-like DNA-binding protein